MQELDDVGLSKTCRAQAEHYAKTHPNRPPFADEVHWAAFYAGGLTYPMER